MLVYGSILESHKAREIAHDFGMSEEQAAAMWFTQTFALVFLKKLFHFI